MRQFVKNNKPYQQTEREDFAQKFISEGAIEVSILYTENFINPIWNNSEWIEGATTEELNEININNALKLETELYKKRQCDGVLAYAEISAEFRLAKLSGLITEETQRDIERALIPTRNEVLAGQWISAKNELELLGSSTIGIDLYNRLHNQITNYINQNY